MTILYDKLRDIKRAGERLVDNRSLIVALFRDIPDLETFSFIKTQEYDDNNYFDSTSLTEINGYPCDYEGYIEEDEDEDQTKSKLPKIENISPIEDLVSRVAEEYDCSSREVTFERKDFQEYRSENDSIERKYLVSYLSGEKLPMSSFSSKNPRWAVYYALDHGRLPEKTEYRLFAKRGNMYIALEYAKHVIKGRLPDRVENFYILDSNEIDRDHLKSYLEFIKNGQEKSLETLPEVHQGSVV